MEIAHSSWGDQESRKWGGKTGNWHGLIRPNGFHDDSLFMGKWLGRPLNHGGWARSSWVVSSSSESILSTTIMMALLLTKSYYDPFLPSEKMNGTTGHGCNCTKRCLEGDNRTFQLTFPFCQENEVVFSLQQPAESYYAKQQQKQWYCIKTCKDYLLLAPFNCCEFGWHFCGKTA